MNRTTLKMLALALALAGTCGSASAKQVPPCSQLPHDIREASRDFNDCLRTPNPTASCGRQGLDVQVFDNHEGRLPRAGRGQVYWEAKAVKDHGPRPGRNRLVYLTTDNPVRDILARYYSADHYDSFCKLH